MDENAGRVNASQVRLLKDACADAMSHVRRLMCSVQVFFENNRRFRRRHDVDPDGAFRLKDTLQVSLDNADNSRLDPEPRR